MRNLASVLDHLRGSVGISFSATSQFPAAELRAVARSAEALRYSCIWFGEGMAREAFVQAGILVAATSEIVVATGIAVAQARDPYAAAHAGRSLAEASGGRFVLGLGTSHRPNVERRGHRYEAPVDFMRDYLSHVHSAGELWAGPAAPSPPIVLGALRKGMLRLAATAADGAYTYFVPLEHTEQARAILGERFLAVSLPVVVAKSRDAARAQADVFCARMLAFENYRNNLLELGWAQSETCGPGSDRLFDALVAWGEPAELERRIRSCFSAGADHVVLNFLDSASPATLTARAELMSSATQLEG
jgi:probable F420-dependent oxidoreductase